MAPGATLKPKAQHKPFTFTIRSPGALIRSRPRATAPQALGVAPLLRDLCECLAAEVGGAVDCGGGGGGEGGEPEVSDLPEALQELVLDRCQYIRFDYFCCVHYQDIIDLLSHPTRGISVVTRCTA